MSKPTKSLSDKKKLIEQGHTFSNEFCQPCDAAIATLIDDYATMMNTGHPLTKEEADLADTISGWNGKAPEAEANEPKNND